jgi:hypothetical protein
MKTKITIASVVILAAVVYWAIAQTAPAPLANIFPTGALVYLEARDFSTLAGDWDRSDERAAWLKSANYEAFSRSALFLKLGQAQTDFATAAGVPPDYALLKSVAGTNSALAIYNIGALQFLYVTRLPSARAMNTALWKLRGNYQTRKAGGVDFYVKEDAATNRVAAFAYSGDLLMLATREDLMAGALALMASSRTGTAPGAQPPSLASEKWFADAVQAAPPGSNDLRLVYSLGRLEQVPQFRSHWVQRGTSLREFSSGLADLERANGEVRERRVLLRANPAAAISDESATGRLLAAVPDDAGFYRARLVSSSAVSNSGLSSSAASGSSYADAEQVEKSIEEKIFAATAPPKLRNDFAPQVELEHEQGSEQDLETRIDQPPLSDDRVARAFAPLRELLSVMAVQAILEIGSTNVDTDQVFVGSQSAVVLLANANWDADAIRGALSSAAGSLWSNGGLGAGWRARAASNGVWELDGLGRIAMAVDGRWLVIGTIGSGGNSTELVSAILARRNRPAVAGSVYAAGWRHAREIPNFERMMRLIDFPQSHAGAGDAGGTLGNPGTGREPMFYSENIASFGRVLGRVQSTAIAVHDLGGMLRETVDYRIVP